MYLVLLYFSWLIYSLLSLPLFQFSPHFLHWILSHWNTDTYVSAHGIPLHKDDSPSSMTQTYLSRTGYRPAVPMTLSLISFTSSLIIYIVCTFSKLWLIFYYSHWFSCSLTFYQPQEYSKNILKTGSLFYISVSIVFKWSYPNAGGIVVVSYILD